MHIMPHHYHHSFSIFTIIFTFSLSFSLLPALPVLPDPDPASITQQQFHPNTTPPATIPSFPEQATVSSTCPINLSAPILPALKSACGGGQLYKGRCCPALAVWVYSAYTHTARSLLSSTPPTTSSSTYYDMPLLPDDSETCVERVEKRMKENGVDLIRPNETCDFVYCFCGIRLGTLSCPHAFGIDGDGSFSLVDQSKVNKLEIDCLTVDRNNNDDNSGCSKCLKSLYKLKKGSQSLKGNTTKWDRRTSKMRNRDCELMGLTWLLNKDRDAYISTVTHVMRALMMDNEGSDPQSCSLSSDGMPLAVDSAEIYGHSSSVTLQFPVVVYFVSILLLVMS